MIIEAWVNGQILSTHLIDDSYLQNIEGFDWENNEKAREMIVSHELESFHKRLEKVFKETLTVIFTLRVESRGNFLTEKQLIDENGQDETAGVYQEPEYSKENAEALGKKKLKKREYNRRQDDGPEPPKIDRPPAQYDNIRSPYGIASDFNSKPK